MEQRGVKLREDDFIFQIVKDPERPPETMLVMAFTGRSAKENHTRLYIDALLSAYVDVPDEALLHAREIPLSQSALGGSYVWVRRDPELVNQLQEAYRKSTETQQQLANGVQTDGLGMLGGSPQGGGWGTLGSPSVWPDLSQQG